MTVPCFLMALLCGWVARVQACKSDLDCSLNGDCKAGKCDCDAAWEGEQCERFATVPTPPGMDIKEPGVTTWGGQAVQHNGRFHMFVSEYVGNCGITSWLTNSQTTRFVADKPEGPWSRKEVVIPVWSTCPSAAITPNGTVVLWTMGNGGGRQPKLGPDAWGKRCENGSTPCGFAKHGCGPNAPPPLHPPPPPPQPHDQGVCTNAWANVSNYKCFAGNCLSDGSERAGNCGDGLCYSAGPPPRHANDSLCAPLTCTPYKDCSVAAGIRCDSDPRCHSFALYSSPWEGQRAKFFNNTGSGTTPVTGWTAWTQVSVDEREDGNSPPWESQAEVDRRPGRVFSPTASRSGEGASTFPLHVSSTGPEGPWKTIAASVNERLTYSLAAPWILPNGTTFWVMQTDIADAPWIPKHLPGNRSIQGSVGTIIRGETYEGPYKVMSRGACSVGEDHSMYIDKRGFHCISHRFSIIGDPACKAINGHLPGGCTIFDASRDGGHAFSKTGWNDTWFCADGKGGHAYCNPDQPPAYNSTIVYKKGGVHRFGTRERPHVLFDGETPVAITNSVQHCQAPGVPDACVVGDPHSCNASNRGCHNQWPGYQDRSFTSITPLRTIKPSN